MREQKHKNKKFLEQEYRQKKKSMQEIAHGLGVSLHAVTYWMLKHGIKRRSMSEATYTKRNPQGDPFKIKKNLSEKEKQLFFVVMGLYLGEGKKYKNCASLALGNTDPLIIRTFLKFLRGICGVEEKKIRAELNIYDDVNIESAMEYWTSVTGLLVSQFSKAVVRKARKKGTYKHWSRYGTLTILVSNKKLYEKVMGCCYQYLCDFSGVINHLNFFDSAEIAQSVEHLNGNEEASGSIPLLGSKFYGTVPLLSSWSKQ